MTTLFILSNAAIVAGYVFLAAFVVPKITAVTLKRTLIGGCGFLITCAMHHALNILHLAFFPNETIQESLHSGLMLAIDIPQAIFVWMFVTGLYVEVRNNWSPWTTVKSENKMVK